MRVDGSVTKLAAAESDAYFHSRPRGSQVGAWAARQGQPIPDRRALEDAVARYTQQFGDGPVERPSYWGGYLLAPHRMEFWQGRRDRLHDRFEYRREAGGWDRRRLAP